MSLKRINRAKNFTVLKKNMSIQINIWLKFHHYFVKVHLLQSNSIDTGIGRLTINNSDNHQSNQC